MDPHNSDISFITLSVNKWGTCMLFYIQLFVNETGESAVG